MAKLRSFLGMINYYSKFLPQLSTTLKPLYGLLHKNTKFESLLRGLLVHYDSIKPLVLDCVASPYGIGAVLSHVLAEGEEKPIAYSSRHSQLQNKVFTAIIFGVTKFQ